MSEIEPAKCVIRFKGKRGAKLAIIPESQASMAPFFRPDVKKSVGDGRHVASIRYLCTKIDKLCQPSSLYLV